MFLKKYHLLTQKKKMSAKKRQKFLNELCRQVFKQEDITFRILVKEFEREKNMSRRQAYRQGHAFLFEVLRYQRQELQARNRFRRLLAKKYELV